MTHANVKSLSPCWLNLASDSVRNLPELRGLSGESALLSNSPTQWRAVVMTGKFLKTLELLQFQYKSWDSPTAETESNTSNTEENTHFNSVSSHNKRTQH